MRPIAYGILKTNKDLFLSWVVCHRKVSGNVPMTRIRKWLDRLGVEYFRRPSFLSLL